jgi:hypothetical protein
MVRKKLQELAVAVPGKTLADHHSGQHVQFDQLLIETAVIGELEGAHQMRLEPNGASLECLGW